jgi:hypothetical protein
LDNVLDCSDEADTFVAVMMNLVAGYDELEPTSTDIPVPDYTRALKTETTRS